MAGVTGLDLDWAAAPERQVDQIDLVDEVVRARDYTNALRELPSTTSCECVCSDPSQNGSTYRDGGRRSDDRGDDEKDEVLLELHFVD